MFYRFQYATTVSFIDSVVSTPRHRKKGSASPTVFTGSVLKEFKVKAKSFEDAKVQFAAFLSGSRHELRSLFGKPTESEYEELGSEVLIDGDWYNTASVCDMCLNGIPHEHGNHLYTNVGNTRVGDGYLEFAA